MSVLSLAYGSYSSAARRRQADSFPAVSPSLFPPSYPRSHLVSLWRRLPRLLAMIARQDFAAWLSTMRRQIHECPKLPSKSTEQASSSMPSSMRSACRKRGPLQSEASLVLASMTQSCGASLPPPHIPHSRMTREATLSV
jgi:hypothetical protein